MGDEIYNHGRYVADFSLTFNCAHRTPPRITNPNKVPTNTRVQGKICKSHSTFRKNTHPLTPYGLTNRGNGYLRKRVPGSVLGPIYMLRLNICNAYIPISFLHKEQHVNLLGGCLTIGDEHVYKIRKCSGKYFQPTPVSVKAAKLLYLI